MLLECLFSTSPAFCWLYESSSCFSNRSLLSSSLISMQDIPSEALTFPKEGFLLVPDDSATMLFISVAFPQK